MRSIHSGLTALPVIVCFTAAIFAQTQPATTRPKDNFDESKAGRFILPDPLMCNDGTVVRDAQTWFTQRRPEILHDFQREVYGRAPGRPNAESFDVDTDPHARNGLAIRKQVTIHLSDAPDAPKINVLIYLPGNSPRPAPLFLCLSFYPLHMVDGDPGIRLMDGWSHGGTRTIANDAQRNTHPFPVDKLLSRGYGIAVLYYSQIDPDFADRLAYGVRSIYLKPGQTDVAPDEWGTIGAWAWGAQRAMDYLQTDKDVDGKHIVMMGHSRLGKTAMWTGASDQRFAMVFAGSSGRGGASLARRNFGETIADLANKYGYQFCANFRTYGPDPDRFTVDTHELIALIAPRPVYLATASLDLHSDPHGEFLAAVAASPVFELLGARGLGNAVFPPLDVPIMHTIAYSCHTGKHEVTPGDWEMAIEFADLQFFNRPPTTRLAD